MNKQIFLILIVLTLNGCAAIKWTHPTKGYGNISTMFDPKGSNEFIRDYDDCQKGADQFMSGLGKAMNPCLSDRHRTKCMKEKYGWKIK
jgi:hypothetical protein